MENLKRKRDYVKAQIDKMFKFAQEGDASVEYDETKLRLDRVHELYKEFIEIENKMLEKVAAIESDLDAVDEQYYFIVPKLQGLLRSKANNFRVVNFDQTLNNTQACGSEVKLPRTTIPPFDGDYREWQSFHDLFVTTIHENTTLSAGQKFQYLKGLLKGEASALVRHFLINDSNYLEAFQRLCKRYDKKRYIVNSFIQTYLDQPNFNKATSTNLARLRDTCDEVIRGLKALGTRAEGRDPWLIFIALQRVDEETRQCWLLQTADEDFPSFQQFLDFLGKRMDSLQGMKVEVKRSPQGKLFSPQTKVMHAAAENCSFCKKDYHNLMECKNFLEANLLTRRDFVKNSHRCFNCLSPTHAVYQCKSKRRCNKCQKKHHAFLHQDEAKSPPSTTGQAPIETTTMITKSINSVILPTAQVLIKDKFGEWRKCRVLLDSGSQTSFASEECVHRLGLHRINARISIRGLNDMNSGVSRGLTTIKVKSMIDESYEIETEVLIVPKITSYQINSNFNLTDLQEFRNLQLADPGFYQSGRIDILLGSDHLFEVICDGRKRMLTSRLIAQNTKFGWIIAGTPIQKERGYEASVNLQLNIDATLKRFWETEEMREASPVSEEEQMCLNHYQETVGRAEDGRYIVRLPFRRTNSKIGNSKAMAIKRFYNLENRFNRDASFHESYKEFMKEYKELRHMELGSFSNIDGYYLPNHGVVKMSSSTTKLRVVFDASAKTTNGVSLNDELAVGPTLQPTLFELLLRFRRHKIVFIADIEKMFRQIWVHPEDTKHQRIIWRNSNKEQLQSFNLLTVTYGTASAPFLAVRTLVQLASDYEKEYPRASEIIRRDFYMDDLISGASSEEEAKKVVLDVITVLNKGGFKLRKWTSNSHKVLETIPEFNRQFSVISFEEESQPVSVLGLRYGPNKDTFCFKMKLNDCKMTKRSMLSESAKVFDPMGWLSPVTIKIKILFQQLWLAKLDWDDQLPPGIQQEWTSIRQEMCNLEHIGIRRWLFNEDKVVELHGFADASEDAYAAVIYSRVVLANGFKTNIVSAKTKVAPINTISIPRLELCAAVLLIKLLKLVMKSLGEDHVIRYYLWTDSRIVLDWISSCPKRWKTFVANRVSYILQHTDRSSWIHVPSSENPADCASRGLCPNELVQFKLWWNGPEWLKGPSNKWPSQHNKEQVEIDAVISERKPSPLVLLANQEPDEWFNNLVSRCSTMNKVVRVIARIRWLFKTKSLKQISQGNKRPEFPTEETHDALMFCIKRMQEEYFGTEIQALRRKENVIKQSKLIALFPFLDNKGVLRVGGRLHNAEVSFGVKHPIILPSKHRLTSLIISDEHIKQLHAGPALLISILKHRFFILRCKDAVKRVIGRCMKCSRLKASQQQQLMGQLPEARVTFERAFLNTGVDYAGPITIRMSKLRGAKRIKCYIALFICMATKALHLELVSDMSTEAFIAALKRFQARRGVCANIYSDNGSNFIGANNELQRVWKSIFSDDRLITYANDSNIRWHFNPPTGSHFGGLWEASVKSTKFHLKRVIGESLLTFEEMTTLLTQIEGILNSRPLCEITKDQIDPLTPSHFLIGHPITLMPEENLMYMKTNKLSRWQHIQQMMQHFWQRWHSEYLLTMQQRQKWTIPISNYNVDDLVVVMEKDLAPTKWLLGRILKLYPGRDGMVRVVDVKTKQGTIKRPINKLCRLPSGSVEPMGAGCSESSHKNKY